MAKGFRSMLAARQGAVNSLVCVGLDAVSEKLPEHLKEYAKIHGDSPAIRLHMEGIIDATAPLASMFKPNIAFYEALDGGIEVLKGLIFGIASISIRVSRYFLTASGEISATLRSAIRRLFSRSMGLMALTSILIWVKIACLP